MSATAFVLDEARSKEKMWKKQQNKIEEDTAAICNEHYLPDGTQFSTMAQLMNMEDGC